MSRTFKHPGDVLTFVAPTGGVTSGTPVQIGGQFVIPEVDADATEDFEGRVTGVHELAKATGAWAAGDALYWDASAAELVTDPTLGLYIGNAAEAALSGDAKGNVRLKAADNGQGTYQVRKRFTVAEVNAGDELVPAIPGKKIRMVDAIAIAVGGAVTSATTVDILATSTASRKLVAYAQASMTQSTVLRAGESGAAVLADGASFTANDVNTPVNVGVTGSDITVATHIDVIFSYALD